MSFPIIFSYWKLKYLGVSVSTCISVGGERAESWFSVRFLPAHSMALIASGLCPAGHIGMWMTQSKPTTPSATWILQVPTAFLALPVWSEHSSRGWNQWDQVSPSKALANLHTKIRRTQRELFLFFSKCIFPPVFKKDWTAKSQLPFYYKSKEKSYNEMILWGFCIDMLSFSQASL